MTLDGYSVLIRRFFFVYFQFALFSCECVRELFVKEMSSLSQSQHDPDTRHDILDYYKGCTTPDGDIRCALPHVVKKIFGYLNQDALTQARAVSKKWRCYVDTNPLTGRP